MSTSGLRRQAGGPMYHQLRQDLLARIRRGEFPPGSQLPSENQLCEQYGVSVTTARRAFLELVKEGVVKRKAGVGTTVAPQVRRARLAFISIDYVGDAWRYVSSVMGEMISGIGEYAWRHDATLNFIGVEDGEAATYLRGLVEERSADGVLLRTANDIREEHLEILERAGMPYVVIKRHIPGRRMNHVNSDDVAGAKLATSHLLGLGHRRIGLVCAKPNVTLGRERLLGYREALSEWGIGFDEKLVRQEPYFTRDCGYRAMRSLLESPAPPSAVFVASDTMALGGYEAAWDLRVKIPDDISIVGYDDIIAAATLQPPLTTIRTSYYDFGNLATRLLLELVEGREVAPQQRMIEPELMVRDSAAPPDSSRAEDSDPDHRILRENETAPGGRLSGRKVHRAGSGEIEHAVARLCESEGAHVVEAGSGKRADAGFLALDLRRDFGASTIGRTLENGRGVAERIAQSGGGRLLLVALCEGMDGPAGRAGGDAVRAGLARIVGELSEEWEARKVTVNAVLYDGEIDGGRDLAGPVALLLSEEGSPLRGETLMLRGTERKR